jgi:predicted phosphodiesterase
MGKLTELADAIPSPKENAAERARVKHLEKLVEEQAAQLERQATAKWSIPKAPKRVTTGCYIRIVIPDTHGCHADPQAIAAFLADLSQFGADSVREVIMLGDHLDCGGFLAAHHCEHYVAETEVSFEDDVNATNVFLDQVQSIVPKAKVTYLEGNHERRLEKWCVTQALRNAKDAEYLRKMFAAENVLHLGKRGIEYIQQGRFYDGLPIPATIRRGKCFFTHGERHGKNACASTLSDFGGCVVFGHVHRSQSYSGSTVHSGSIASYCPGKLCKDQPLWCHSRPTGWNSGYGVQYVAKGGEFQHINALIADGGSFLGPLLRMVKQ